MYQRKAIRRLKGRRPQAVYQSLGDDYPACNSVVGSMTAGSSCTLPDGSNIATWNGSQLTNPAGSAIDPANAAALLAGGWKSNQIAGASSASAPGIGSQVGAAAAAIFGNLFGPKPNTSGVVSSGPSTTTLLLVGGAAIAAIYLITKD